MVRKPSRGAVLLRLLVVLSFVLTALPAYAALPAPRVASAAPSAAPQGSTTAAPAPAVTNTLKLQVVSARDEVRHPGGPVTAGQAIGQYKFIINEDNTGDPWQPRNLGCDPSDPAYPANCNWPSVRAQPGWSPIITQGDETILNGGAGINLPPGKYLISVIADGYKIDGEHFTVPLADPGVISVSLQPYPLPTATIRIRVFEDNASTNGQPDIPSEHGLAGFKGYVADILGQVSQDMFGNPMCTQYETDGSGQIILDPDLQPIPIPGTGGDCLSDANGDIVIPNLGPNRWSVFAVPPAGEEWIQTTTLEGAHEWDTWIQEGNTGNDTEFAVAGEPFPFTIMGYVKPTAMPPSSATGQIKGVIASVEVYVPFNGGLPYQGGLWGGLSGAKIDHLIPDGWVSLSDLQNGDQMIYTGPADANGAFQINNVPDGNYLLTYWDRAQSHILDWFQVTVSNGQVVDLGVMFLTGWYSKITGYVFRDDNENGKRDPGEIGVSDFPLVLKKRDNTQMDRGTKAFTSGPDGYYIFEQVYPLGQWIVAEAYSDRYYTTGVTWQANNQPSETTVLGNGVDVNFLALIGQGGRLDWGVKAYGPTQNGGIVGTVVYDTTRNELDARFQAVEPWAPGIPDLTVNLWTPVPDLVNGGYLKDANGAYSKGALLETVTTETWARPVDCQARNADGNPVDQQVLPPATGGHECLEAPLMGTQFGQEFAAVDGNYGFSPVPAGDYLVEVVIPQDAYGRDMFKVVKEEDINVFTGDVFVPQLPPPLCAGALHTVTVTNPDFLAQGGSPYEGMQMPLCDVKLVTVSNGRSIAPLFTLFTDTPIPGRFYNYIVDDLNLSTDPTTTFFGEKAGVPQVPIGLYDFANNLVETVDSDPNGVTDILLPSTTTINCPTPSGVCANVYRTVGNDPGVPGRLNPNYNPLFRTIAAQFEVWPGVIIPSDQAPTQVGVTIQSPGSQNMNAVTCALAASTPQIFSVTPRPILNGGGPLTITGVGFGATRGSGIVSVGGVSATIQSWTDRQIQISVPGSVGPGPKQLLVRAGNGQTTVNGITVHILGPGYNPTIFNVGPGRPYATIQDALDAAANTAQALLMVYPNTPVPFTNPFGVYYENIIMQTPVKLQGVGPGGVYPDKSSVPGSVIDGGAFGGDTPVANAWRDRVGGAMTWAGNQTVYEAQTVWVAPLTQTNFGSSFKAAIDGFSVQGGDQQGFPNNVNVIGGGPTGLPATVQVQGGGVYVNGYAHHLQLTNNIFRANGGAYGGAIRLGTPNIPAPNTSNENDNINISYNRLILNGGTNLAGGIAIFAGAASYTVSHNDICGNFSAEYGGGLTHYGWSPNGEIHHNRIYFNRSYDEGGGIMIAGELPADPNQLSPGAGPVNIYNNLLQGNLANDDGGGLRFLMAGNSPYNVYNNVIVNNVSTHEGGGVALNDAPDVRFFNNTVMKNITTATAQTSNGSPAPAGFSTIANSGLLQNTLPPGSPLFSKPVLFNNIFWDNRAGAWTGGGIAGIGLAGDPNAISYWDAGVADGTGLLDITNSILQSSTLNSSAIIASASNKVGQDPSVIATYDVSVLAMPWRTNLHFVQANLVAVEAPVNLMGDYRLNTGSPAINAGANSKTIGALTVVAPSTDYNDRTRGATVDMGAYEYVAVGTPGFPVTGILDTFNRADAGSLGPAWTGDVASFRIRNLRAQVLATGAVRWNGTSFGPNQEAYFTFNQISTNATNHSVFLKLQGSNPRTAGTSWIQASYDATARRVYVKTRTATQGIITRASWPAQFVANDRLGARAMSNGTVTVYKNTTQIGAVDVTSGPSGWPMSLSAGGGYIGMWFNGPNFQIAGNATRPDDFGGGTVP